jgi:hypothetical protein
MPTTYINRGRNKRNFVVSKEFNIDNGAGTTDDDLLVYFPDEVTLHSANVVYTEASDSGDASSANVKLGTAAAGAQIVAATNLENAKAVSSTTSLTLAMTRLVAGTAVWVRHTGVATTQVGKYKVALEYEVEA